MGNSAIKNALDTVTTRIPVPGLHLLVVRRAARGGQTQAEPAVFELAWLSAIGTATFFAGVIAGPLLGLSVAGTLRVFLRTCYRMRYSMVAILAMLGLGIHDPLLGHGRNNGPGHDQHRRAVSIFRNAARMAGRGADRHRRRIERLVRQSAGDHGQSTRLESGADGGGEFGGRRDGQDDRRAIHHRGLRGHGQEGREGDLFRAVLLHSIVLAAIVGLIVTAYAYVVPQWIPSGLSFR